MNQLKDYIQRDNLTKSQTDVLQQYEDNIAEMHCQQDKLEKEKEHLKNDLALLNKQMKNEHIQITHLKHNNEQLRQKVTCLEEQLANKDTLIQDNIKHQNNLQHQMNSLKVTITI